MLALQAQGKGKRDAAGYAGMMNLAVNPLNNAWEELEEELALEEIKLTKALIRENLDEEIKLTKEQGDATYHNGKIGISVQRDTRWDQRASGRAYNSDSGASLLVGNLSSKCVGLHCMSRRCSKCEEARETKLKKQWEYHNVLNKAEWLYYSWQHETHLCPRNYTGSLKGMEAKGSFKIVTELYTTTNAFVCTYVMDDDSSTKAILRHSLEAKVREGRMLREDWPKTEAGEKVKDTGILLTKDAEHTLSLP
jgi:hypothetical protein